MSSAHSARILRAIFLQAIDILTAVKASHAALWHLVGKPAENIGEYPLCDYSLHAVASRPAKVRESLVSTSFCGTSTRGFAAKDEPAVAVCLLPGTELTFEQDVRYSRNWLLTKSAGFRVAQFCVTQPKAPEQHHDAMLFPDGTIILVNLLSEGEHTQVLQLPATPLGEVGARAEHAPVYSIQQVDRVQIHLLSSLMSPGADN